jgi:hypothetical protein
MCYPFLAHVGETFAFVLCTLCSILYLTLVKVQNVTFWVK